MRAKTYLSPGDQWDRTARLYEGSWSGSATDGLGTDWWLGKIVLPHRLFVPGDSVIVALCNGQGIRQPVFGVSSKGRAVRGLYLRFAALRDYGPPLLGEECRRHIEERREDEEDLGLVIRDRAIDRARGGTMEFPHGSLRLAEPPERLIGLAPSAAAVRRYVVEELRMGGTP